MGEIFAVLSGKGGTGKTSVCAGIATALAEQKKKVLCIDCDVGLRNLDISLGLTESGALSFLDVAEGNCAADCADRHPVYESLFFLTAPMNRSADEIAPDAFGEMLSQAKRKYDYIFLDAPAGVDAGQTVRIRNEGCVGSNGGPNGDLYVYLYVKPHKFFERDGTTVLCEVPINIVQATLGADIKVPTLDGQVTMKVPEGTQPGKVMRIKGKGIPNLRGGSRGDQLVRIKVVVPTKLSDKQKDALRKFADISKDNINPEETMTITIHSIDTIATAAQEFIAQMGDNKIFAFYGAMGAGKTTFVKALCEAMGVTDTVNSPTFAIVNEYDTPSGRPIYHFDFYRIKRLAEVYDMGYEDYFYGRGLCFIEWPELVEELLPEETIKVTIEEQPDGTRTVKY